MSIQRRRFLKTATGLLATPALLVPRLARGDDPKPADALSSAFPAQDPKLVMEMVAVSHGNVARVKELLAMSPTYAKAAWDWGFGDWETALGASSHVGNREIAALLMENGARADIFTFAMLGDLDVVKAYIAAHPGIQKTHGPHGLTLLHHARKGGDVSAPVVAYLESLGDADPVYATVPLADPDKAACVGSYSFGPGAADQFGVALNKDGALGIKRLPDGVTRSLFHVGNHEFHVPGNSNVRIRFEVENGAAKSLAIVEGGATLSARRILG